MVEVCREALQFFKSHSDSDASEPYDDCVSDAMVTFRVIITLGDPRVVSYYNDVEHLKTIGSKKDKQTKTKPTHKAFVCIKGSSFWWGKMQEHEKSRRPCRNCIRRCANSTKRWSRAASGLAIPTT